MSCQKRHLQKGLSIVELMIAIVLGLFLIAAVVQIAVNSNQSFRSATNLSRLQENGRMATQLLSSAIKRAGYLGGHTDPSNIIGGTTPPIVPTNLADALSCSTTDNSWGRMIHHAIVGLDDTATGYNCIAKDNTQPGGYLRGDVLTIRYANPKTETILTSPSPNQLYLKHTVIEGLVLEAKDKNNSNNFSISTGLLMHRKLIAQSYFIGNSGRSCNGQPIPSLFRIELDNNGRPSAEKELIPGVENMQIQYGNGQRYVNAKDITTIADWKALVSVKISLLIRSACPELQHNDTQTYKIGNIEYQPNDNFRRQEYSRLIKLNLNTLGLSKVEQ